MGTVLFMEWKKIKWRKDKQCAYCRCANDVRAPSFPTDMRDVSPLFVVSRTSRPCSVVPRRSGEGRIKCGVCLGTETVTYMAADGSMVTQACPECGGCGDVSCVNCKGTGRMSPLFLDSRISRDPESELEDVGIL